jgi:hypothetical protein
MAVGGTARKISFAGAIGDGSVSLSYDDSGRTGDLSASADDAGRLARFLDLYSRFSGGSVRLTGKRTSANGPMVGSFEMANFDVLNEPAMKNIVTGSAPSVPASGFNASRVHFQRMVADFRKTDQQITIQDALLRGAAVGATFSGRYDLSTTQLSISGTYLPNYAFNNAFSHIPFVGLFLGGGFREGLVGVTFKITGTLASPRVFYNPLSAVAPGIFRKIFEFQ